MSDNSGGLAETSIEPLLVQCGHGAEMSRLIGRRADLGENFLAATVERLDGKPTLTFRHHDPDGKVLNEDRLTAK